MPRHSAKSPEPLSDSAVAFQFPLSRKSLTKAELARQLRISTRSVDELMRQKKIPFKRISSRMIRYDLDAVEAALSKFTVREVS